jgi:hypothetical protein
MLRDAISATLRRLGWLGLLLCAAVAAPDFVASGAAKTDDIPLST